MHLHNSGSRRKDFWSPKQFMMLKPVGFNQLLSKNYRVTTEFKLQWNHRLKGLQSIRNRRSNDPGSAFLVYYDTDKIQRARRVWLVYISRIVDTMIFFLLQCMFSCTVLGTDISDYDKISGFYNSGFETTSNTLTD